MSKNINASLMTLTQTAFDGLQYVESGDYAEGDRILKKVIRKLEVVPKYKNNKDALLLLATAYNYESLSLSNQGKLKQARELVEQSQEIFKSIKTDWKDPRYWYSWYNYANTFEVLSDIQRAEGDDFAAYESCKERYEILTMIRKANPSQQVDTTILNSLGNLCVYAYSVDAKDAMEYNKRYIKACKKIYGEDFQHEMVADAYERIGDLYCQAGNDKQGRKYFKEAIRILTNVTRNDKRNYMAQILLAQVYSYLGDLEKRMGNLEKAEVAYEAAVDKLEDVPEVATTYLSVAYSRLEYKFNLSQILDLLDDKRSKIELLEEVISSINGYLSQVSQLKDMSENIVNLYRNCLEEEVWDLVAMGEFGRVDLKFAEFYTFVLSLYGHDLFSSESTVENLNWTVELQLELLDKTLALLENKGKIREALAACDNFLECLNRIDHEIAGRFSVDRIRRDVERRRSLLGKNGNS